MDALGGNRETFDNFSRAEHEVIFGDHGLLSTQGIALATIFQTLMVESCKGNLSFGFCIRLSRDNLESTVPEHSKAGRLRLHLRKPPCEVRHGRRLQTGS